MRRLWPVLFFALIPLVPLWRAVFRGEAIGPFDQVRQMAPWYAPRPDQPWDVLPVDGVLQFYPWRDLVLRSWGEGKLPLWNPYQLGGTPLLANSQSAAFYPPHIVLGVLHVPTGLAMVLLAWFHLFWSGLGTFFLARRLGANQTGAAVAGTSFALSAFMLSWTALPSVISTVAWIPWILACIAALFREDAVLPSEAEDGKTPHTQGRRTRTLIALAASVGMMILAGHLQFTAYGFMAAGLMAVALVLTTRQAPLKSALQCFLALAFGALLALPQLLPVLSYSQFSHRRNTPTPEGYQAYVSSAIRPFELATVPHATLEGNPRAWSLRENEQVPSYWPLYVKQGANFAESAVALGPLVLSLLLLAPWRRREMIPLAVVGGFALLLALGTALNALLYFRVPGWSSTGSPGRVIVLFVLAASVIAGLAISNPPRLPKDGLKGLLPLLVPILASLPFVYLAMNVPAPQAEFDPKAVSGLAAAALIQAAPGMLIAVIVAATALSFAFRQDRPAARAALLAAPILIALAAAAHELVPTGQPLAPVAPPSATERVAVVNEPWGLSRAAMALLPPNTASLGRVHELSGYDSLLHRDTVALLNDINGKDSAPMANGNMMFVKPTADSAKLAAAGVTEVWSQAEIPALGVPTAGSGYFRYRLDGPGRASTPAGPAQITSETLSGIKLQATGPGRLVLRDRMMPGWTARVDGKPVPLVGTLWREVELSEGSHQVEMDYYPPGLSTGWLIGFTGWFLLAMAAIATRRRTSSAKIESK